MKTGKEFLFLAQTLFGGAAAAFLFWALFVGYYAFTGHYMDFGGAR